MIPQLSTTRSPREAVVMASKGWSWTWQRCGRYEYQKVLVHTTNPDNLVPSAPRGSGGVLRVAARYAAGRKRCSSTS